MDHGPELPPPALLMQLITGKFVTQMVAVLAQLGVANQLKDGPRSAAELAPETGAHPDSLYRLLRALTVVGVLSEGADARFSLTPMGELLRDDHPASLSGMAKFMGEGWHSAAWANLLHAVKTNSSAFVQTHGSSPWQWVQTHAKEGEVFNDAMTSFSKMSTAPVVAAYDFSGFRRIADIGGGHGFLLSGILKAAPSASGVLFDLPQVVAGARKTLESEGVAARCQMVGGSFLDGVPAGCDAYVIKHIIHDWDDQRCVTILKGCAAGLNPGGKVLVLEQVVPPAGVPSFAKLLDMEMLVVTDGGRERTEAEFAALFVKAGLRLTRVVPTHSPLCVIEAVKA